MTAFNEAFPYTYEVLVELDDGGDPRALGGAVTVALCGHWDHQPPCRWPHHTETIPVGSRSVVRVSYSCDRDEEPEVRWRIDEGLAVGSLTGPDGDTSTWTVLPDPREP